MLRFVTKVPAVAEMTVVLRRDDVALALGNFKSQPRKLGLLLVVDSQALALGYGFA